MSKNNDKIIKGSVVYVGDMPLNTALRKFKQKVDDSGVLETIKSKMYYEKPTTRRKRRAGAARARWLKRLKDQQLPPKNY